MRLVRFKSSNEFTVAPVSMRMSRAAFRMTLLPHIRPVARPSARVSTLFPGPGQRPSSSIPAIRVSMPKRIRYARIRAVATDSQLLQHNAECEYRQDAPGVMGKLPQTKPGWQMTLVRGVVRIVKVKLGQPAVLLPRVPE